MTDNSADINDTENLDITSPAAEAEHSEAPREVSVEEVSNYDKERNVIHGKVHGELPKTGSDSEHAGSFGITEKDAKPVLVCVSKDTGSHILANTDQRLGNRSKDLLTGIAGESVSVAFSLGATATSTANGGSQALTVALCASTAVVTVLGYRLFQNHLNRKYLRVAAQNYTRDHDNPAEQAQKLIQSLEDNDLAINDRHIMDKDQIEKHLSRAEIYSTKRKRAKDHTALTSFKQNSQHVHNFNQQLLKDFVSTPKNIWPIFKDTVAGVKDSVTSVLYIDTLADKLDAKNAALYVAMIGTFAAEVTFIAANGVGISDQLSPVFQAAQNDTPVLETVRNNASNLITSTLSSVAILASLLPMAQLAQEVSHDKNTLTDGKTSLLKKAYHKINPPPPEPAYKLDYYNMPVANPNVSNDNKAKSKPFNNFTHDYYGTPTDSNAPNIMP